MGAGPEDKWHREAWGREESWPEGTYELFGPKIQGNPYNTRVHRLLLHGQATLEQYLEELCSFQGVQDWLGDHISYEGIVWHHPDGRMVKIKRRDFGFPWPHWR